MPSTPTPPVATPSATAAPMPDPTPAVTPAATPGALAASFPLVASCAPSAVPGATTVSIPNTPKKAVVLRVPILMYHRIVPRAEAGNSLPGLVVPPDLFSAQMDALQAAGWHTITMATLAADLQAGIRPAAKTFVITFDDGYDDGYTYALPILQAHGYTATYYVIPGRFDKGAFLTSDHVRALAAAGMEIGDHTLNHVPIGSRPPAIITYQVDTAAARIAQVTGVWPASFAYPFGRMSAQARAGVAACGQLRTAVIESPPDLVVPPSPSPSAGPIGAGTSPSPAPTPAPTAAPNPTPAPSSAPLSGAGGANPSPPPLSAPRPVRRPSTVVAFPSVYETWANRFELPRLRVSPSVSPSELVAMLAPYA